MLFVVFGGFGWMVASCVGLCLGPPLIDWTVASPDHAGDLV